MGIQRSRRGRGPSQEGEQGENRGEESSDPQHLDMPGSGVEIENEAAK